MSGLRHNIAGTVVLYNPSDHVFDNMLSYIDQVAKLYVVDNSTHYNDRLLQKLKAIEKIVYISQEGNKGIAVALNAGAMQAMDDGFEFLLTMDQDTSLSANYVIELMKPFIPHMPEKIGIIAPRYTERLSTHAKAVQDILFTMTSGNILNLNAYKKTGPFLNELFIDHVDHEYCLRLNSRGFRVVQVNDVEIIHRPGTLTSMFKGMVSFSSHSPQRLYYFCRNGFYVSDLYRRDFPAFRHAFVNLLMKEIAKIPFEKSKLKRLRMIINGYVDHKKKKFGPIPQSEMN